MGFQDTIVARTVRKAIFGTGQHVLSVDSQVSMRIIVNNVLRKDQMENVNVQLVQLRQWLVTVLVKLRAVSLQMQMMESVPHVLIITLFITENAEIVSLKF